MRLGYRRGYGWVFTRDPNAGGGSSGPSPLTDLQILAADTSCVAVLLADPSTMFLGQNLSPIGGQVSIWVDSADPSRTAVQTGPTSRRPTRQLAGGGLLYDGVDDWLSADYIADAVSITQHATIITSQVNDALTSTRCVFSLGRTTTGSADFLRHGQVANPRIRSLLFRNSAGTSVTTGANTNDPGSGPYACRDTIRIDPTGDFSILSEPSGVFGSTPHPGAPTVHNLSSVGSFRTNSTANTAFFGGIIWAIIVWNSSAPSATSLAAANRLLNSRGYP